MLELLINPKKAERRPWQMFFIGLLYASLSIFLARFLFYSDNALSRYMGVFVVLFSVIFSLPFVYYTIKLEERKDSEFSGERKLLREHTKAIMTFIWLFLGFLVAFSIGYINPNFLGFVIIFLLPLIVAFDKLIMKILELSQNKGKYYLYLLITLIWLLFGIFFGLSFFNEHAIFGSSAS